MRRAKTNSVFSCQSGVSSEGEVLHAVELAERALKGEEHTEAEPPRIRPSALPSSGPSIVSISGGGRRDHAASSNVTTMRLPGAARAASSFSDLVSRHLRRKIAER